MDLKLLESIKSNQPEITKNLLLQGADPLAWYYEDEDEDETNYISTLILAVKHSPLEILKLLVSTEYERKGITHGEYFNKIGCMQDAIITAINLNVKDKLNYLLESAVTYRLINEIDKLLIMNAATKYPEMLEICESKFTSASNHIRVYKV